MQAYTSSTPCGATSYTWSNNMSMTGSSTTNSISYTPVGTANGFVQVIANGVAGCASTPATLNVFRNPVVTQPACLNSGIATVGAVYTSSQANTTWTFPPTFTASTPAAGTTATINVIGTPSLTYNSIAVANGCSTTFVPTIAPVTYTLSLNETDPNSTVISANFVSGTTYRLWNCNPLPFGAAASSWGSSFTFGMANPGPGSYTILCDPAPAGGCWQAPPCTTTEFNAMILDGRDRPVLLDQSKRMDVKEEGDVKVIPNPNSGHFNFLVEREFTEGMATLFDSKGARVGEPIRVIQGLNEWPNRALAPGVYTLTITLDGSAVSRRIVVSKE